MSVAPTKRFAKERANTLYRDLSAQIFRTIQSPDSNERLRKRDKEFLSALKKRQRRKTEEFRARCADDRVTPALMAFHA